MSIEKYLTALDEQRDALARNLVTMGVQASETEKLNTLVPKVLQIPQAKQDITLFRASIDALHDYGEKVYTCSCGEKYTETIPATGHSESAWIIDKAATATENGSKHTECTTCGKVIKTEGIPATGEVSDKKETVIFTGSAKTSGWGQAITLSTTKEGGSFDSSVIEKDGYFEFQFKGGTDKAEIILQSWSGGAV